MTSMNYYQHYYYYYYSQIFGVVQMTIIDKKKISYVLAIDNIWRY